MDVFSLVRDAQSGCMGLTTSCTSVQREVEALQGGTDALHASIVDLTATVRTVPAGLAATEVEIASLCCLHDASAASTARLAAEALGVCLEEAALVDAGVCARSAALSALDAFCVGAVAAPGLARTAEAGRLSALRAELAAQNTALRTTNAEIEGKSTAVAANDGVIMRNDAAAALCEANFRTVKEGSPALLTALGNAKVAVGIAEGAATVAETEAAAALAATECARKKLLLSVARRDALRRRIKSLGI